MAALCGLSVLTLLMLSHTECLCVEPAPYDADQECSGSDPTTPDNNTFVLLDTQHYLTLAFLWFADDESIDLFSFPVPDDPVRWVLANETDCNNVWQYCGNSSSDILITQFISRGNISNMELTISIEFNFFDISQPHRQLSCSESDQEVLIIEADDTTGIRNIHIQHIQCGHSGISDIPGGASRYDFTYIPSEDFELVFRTNISESVCVNISRVRIFYHFCPAIVNSFVQYNFTASGSETNGSCVSNAVPLTNDTFSARCDENPVWNFDTTVSCECDRGHTANNSECIACPIGTFKTDIGDGPCLECPSNSITSTTGSEFCTCDIGYERSNPLNLSSSCDDCSPNDYRNAQGLCVPCPLPGDINEGALLDRCRCANGSEISSGDSEGNSGSTPCEFCAANYFRLPENSTCTLCPPGSRRELDTSLEENCTCMNGSFTAEGVVQTTFEPCNHCASTHYSDGMQCYRCPGNSFSESPTDVQCRCMDNTINPNGQLSTTTEDNCVCVSGFYRPGDSGRCDDGPCLPCPMNSHRNYDTMETICPCTSGFLRDPSMNSSLPCHPIIGFTQNSIIIPEGNDSNHLVTLSVFISTAVPETLTVSLSMSPTSLDIHVELLTTSIVFSGNDLSKDVTLRIAGDLVALEDGQIFNLVLLEGDGYIIGGSTVGMSYYGNLEVVVQDDDVVVIGFEKEELRVSTSVESVEVSVMISTDISRELVIQVTTSDSSVSISLENDTLTFQPNGARSKTFTLNINEELRSDRVVVMLELADSTTPLAEFQDRLRFGGVSGTFGELTLLISNPVSEGAKAGIAIGSVFVFVLVLALIIVVIVILFYCYRQGNKKSYGRNVHMESNDSYGVCPTKPDPEDSKETSI